MESFPVTIPVPSSAPQSIRGESGGKAVSPRSFQHVVDIFARLTIVAMPLVAFGLGIHQLKGGWDDGAITAAFARTLAETHRFALTPFSAEVEGFSSLTWVLLLAIPRYLSPNADAILVWMKFLSAISFMLSLFVFRRLAYRTLAKPEQANLACILAALIPCPMLETLNGMEMNLYLFLVLCLVEVLTVFTTRHRTLLIWSLTSAIVATRFESPFLMVAVISGLILSQERKSANRLGAATGTAFATLELWRYVRFGVWMPNTVYAKMLQPYSPPHRLVPILRTRILGETEILQVVGIPLTVLLLIAAGTMLARRESLSRSMESVPPTLGLFFVFFLALSGLPGIIFILVRPGQELFKLAISFAIVGAFTLYSCFQKETRRPVEALTIMLVAAGIAFNQIFGSNWGYPGRMILPCIPFFTLAISLALERLLSSDRWRRLAMMGCIFCQVVVLLFVARAMWNENPVSVASVEKTGRAADSVRRLLDRDSLSVFTPDVGASSLYFRRLKILDSALLTNSYLAHHGYQASEEYLHFESPEIIETHGIWSTLTNVYKTELIRNYSVVIIDQTRLLLRSDIYSQLYSRVSTKAEIYTVFGAQCLGTADSNSPKDDIDFVNARKRCLYITGDDVSRATMSNP